MRPFTPADTKHEAGSDGSARQLHLPDLLKAHSRTAPAPAASGELRAPWCVASCLSSTFPPTSAFPQLHGGKAPTGPSTRRRGRLGFDTETSTLLRRRGRHGSGIEASAPPSGFQEVGKASTWWWHSSGSRKAGLRRPGSYDAPATEACDGTLSMQDCTDFRRGSPTTTETCDGRLGMRSRQLP